VYQVTGYLLIAHTDLPNIILPHLQFVWGKSLFGVDESNRQQFALSIFDNPKLDYVAMPNLRGTHACGPCKP
jgi:hypothetical protein